MGWRDRATHPEETPEDARARKSRDWRYVPHQADAGLFDEVINELE